MHINKKIVKKRMVELNFIQDDLAHKSGLSRTTISNIFNGKSATANTFNKIADALEVPVKDIVIFD